MPKEQKEPEQKSRMGDVSLEFLEFEDEDGKPIKLDEDDAEAKPE